MKTKLILILAVAVLSACSNDMTPADGLKARLAETAADGKILFGQQDALMYGHSWKSEPGDSLDRPDAGLRRPMFLTVIIFGVDWI